MNELVFDLISCMHMAWNGHLLKLIIKIKGETHFYNLFLNNLILSTLKDKGMD